MKEMSPCQIRFAKEDIPPHSCLKSLRVTIFISSPASQFTEMLVLTSFLLFRHFDIQLLQTIVSGIN